MRNAEIRSDIDLESASNNTSQAPAWVDAVTDVNVHIARVKDISTSFASCHELTILHSGKTWQNAHEAPYGPF
jgi:hypothetical protein